MTRHATVAASSAFTDVYVAGSTVSHTATHVSDLQRYVNVVPPVEVFPDDVVLFSTTNRADVGQISTTKPLRQPWVVQSSSYSNIGATWHAYVFLDEVPKEDDVIIVWVSMEDGATGVNWDTAGLGIWTDATGGANGDGRIRNGAQTMAGLCGYHVVTAAEEAAGKTDWNISSLLDSQEYMLTNVAVVRGADTTNPIANVSYNQTGNAGTSTHYTSSFSASVSGGLVLSGLFSEKPVYYGSMPNSSWTQYWQKVREAQAYPYTYAGSIMVARYEEPSQASGFVNSQGMALSAATPSTQDTGYVSISVLLRPADTGTTSNWTSATNYAGTYSGQNYGNYTSMWIGTGLSHPGPNPRILSDDFNVLDWDKWWFQTAYVSNGALIVYGSNGFADYDGDDPQFDNAHNLALTWELTSLTPGSNNCGVGVYSGTGGTGEDNIEIKYNGTNWLLSNGTTTFTPIGKFFRFREDRHRWAFETSADGLTWKLHEYVHRARARMTSSIGFKVFSRQDTGHAFSVTQFYADRIVPHFETPGEWKFAVNSSNNNNVLTSCIVLRNVTENSGTGRPEVASTSQNVGGTDYMPLPNDGSNLTDDHGLTVAFLTWTDSSQGGGEVTTEPNQTPVTISGITWEPLSPAVVSSREGASPLVYVGTQLWTARRTTGTYTGTTTVTGNTGGTFYYEGWGVVATFKDWAGSA